MITSIVAVAALAMAVVWGVAAPPGRPFSWTMFSGSSKALLWLRDGSRRRLASTDDLHLTPDSYYLLESDLKQLARAGALPVLDGLILGSRGSWKVACDTDARLCTEHIKPGDELARAARCCASVALRLSRPSPPNW